MVKMGATEGAGLPVLCEPWNLQARRAASTAFEKSACRGGATSYTDVEQDEWWFFLVWDRIWRRVMVCGYLQVDACSGGRRRSALIRNMYGWRGGRHELQIGSASWPD
jgi:hypothetical protein